MQCPGFQSLQHGKRLSKTRISRVENKRQYPANTNIQMLKPPCPPLLLSSPSAGRQAFTFQARNDKRLLTSGQRKIIRMLKFKISQGNSPARLHYIKAHSQQNIEFPPLKRGNKSQSTQLQFFQKESNSLHSHLLRKECTRHDIYG